MPSMEGSGARLSGSGLFAPDGYGYGATPDDAVRQLLQNAHTLVYKIRRSSLRQVIDRLPSRKDG